MLDLYTLFVEQVFGGFWMSAVGLVLVMLIILAIGKVSSLTILEYCSMFLFALALGYGYAIVTILCFFFATVYMVLSIIGFQKRGGGN